MLDPTFSGDGLFEIPTTAFGYNIYDLALEPGGKIVVVGTIALADMSAASFSVGRVLADGSAMDSGFGEFGTGVEPVSFGPKWANSWAVDIRPDGKISRGRRRVRRPPSPSPTSVWRG